MTINDPGREYLVVGKTYTHEELEGGNSPEGCAREVHEHVQKLKAKGGNVEAFMDGYISICGKMYAHRVAEGEIETSMLTETEFDEKVRAELKRLEK